MIILMFKNKNLIMIIIKSNKNDNHNQINFDSKALSFSSLPTECIP